VCVCVCVCVCVVCIVGKICCCGVVPYALV